MPIASLPFQSEKGVCPPRRDLCRQIAAGKQKDWDTRNVQFMLLSHLYLTYHTWQCLQSSGTIGIAKESDRVKDTSLG